MLWAMPGAVCWAAQVAAAHRLEQRGMCRGWAADGVWPSCCGLACVPRTRQRWLAACDWHCAAVTSASCVCLD